MADPGSEFKPVERREAKRFEPPPWERDQFEELARQRAEQEAEQARLQAEAQAALAQEQAAAAERTMQQPLEPAPGAVSAAQTIDAETVADDNAPPAAGSPTTMAEVSGPEEAQLTEMLAGLAQEEPPAAEAYWKVNVAIGSVVVVIGLMFVVWAVTALVGAAKSGVVGVFGGSVLLIFGVGFMGGGVYVVVKNLRQQGVL